MTSWIDGSFVYSTSEAWLNYMRLFRNGSLKTDGSGLFPPRNTARAPLINFPPAKYLSTLSPERMFRKSISFSAFFVDFVKIHSQIFACYLFS